MTTASLLTDAESRMKKTLEALNREMNTVRTGRATPSLLENVLVSYHGVPTPINQLATVGSLLYNLGTEALSLRLNGASSSQAWD